MEKHAELLVARAAIKEAADPQGKGYKVSAHAQLTRSTSENVGRCKEQKDVIERCRLLAKAKIEGRDKSPEFLNFDLIAVDTAKVEANASDRISATPATQKRISLSPVVKTKLAESRLRKCVEATLSDETNLDDEDPSKKPEKARRNTISN